MFKRLALACLFSLALTAQSYAAGMPVPSVEYSADRVIESEAGTFGGKVFCAHDRERMETQISGVTSVMILRRDKQVGWMLMPMQKMYTQMDLAKAASQTGAAPDSQVDITEVGSESVEGFTATKYKMLMKDGSAGGFIWITSQGIPVKMDMLSKMNGKKSHMTMTLQNLTVGPQDPKLFELPTDYLAAPGLNLGGGVAKPDLKGMMKGALGLGR